MNQNLSTHKRKNRWLCVFDLDNKQDDYAKCLQTIQWLEGIDKEGNESSNQNEPIVPFVVTYAPDDGILNTDWLCRLELGIPARKKIVEKNRFLRGLQKEPFHNGFYYYFRIHMSDELDIVNLQYLVLLFQSENDITSRCAVRLMEREKEQWTKSDYYRAAHFLRFISPKFHFFYACETDEILSLKPLSERRVGIQKTFIPLMIIDKELNDELGKRYYLSVGDPSKKFADLAKEIFVQGDEIPARTKELFEIGCCMLFNNIDGRKYATKDKKEKLLEVICNAVKAVEGLTPLEMVLFGALAEEAFIDLNKEHTEYYLYEIQQFSIAVLQLLENVVHHSELKTGVFGFRIHKNPHSILSNYPGYVVTKLSTCAELFISDKNTKDNIVSNFIYNHNVNPELRNATARIKLSNLFGIPGDADEDVWRMWQQFRIENRELCHGLLTFARTSYTLGSAMRVRSSTKFSKAGGEEFFCYAPENPVVSAENDGCRIPGTQYAFLMQSKSLKEASQKHHRAGPVFQFSHLSYTTTYKELARCLYLKKLHYISSEEIERQLRKADNIKVHGQARKDAISSTWKTWFENYFNRFNQNGIILEFDLSPISRSDTPSYESQLEAFCKGFLASSFFRKQGTVRYILLTNTSLHIGQVFTAAFLAVKEQLTLNEICVYFYPCDDKQTIAYSFAASLYELTKNYPNVDKNDSFPRVFPRGLLYKNDEECTPFEKEMIKQAEIPITSRMYHGFKIENTHMRLGNKVHIDSFYEMALFFENHNNSYYTAFLFLRFLLEHEYLSDEKPILFYGYTSYSRGILWALTKILEEFNLINGKQSRAPEVAFVIYQNDLQIESDETGVQMYYSKQEWQNDPETIWEASDTTLIQIVPISSSLTTFKKMQAKLEEETKQVFLPRVNFTAFWVRDDYAKKWEEKQREAQETGRPYDSRPFEDLSDEEKKDIFKDPTDAESVFWEQVDIADKRIHSLMLSQPTYYLTQVTSYWRSPLNCKKCFPPNPILEIPLVETDPTSTIPTQQFYLEPKGSKSISITNSENDIRVASLHNLVLYGHISRGANHYQYYIRTRRYFHQEHEKVKEWLKNLRRIQGVDSSSKVINILVQPKHTSNVEFGQYVYEYFFGGEAENIVINTEKEFRSNFKAEYNGLFIWIREQIKKGLVVHFHYVDTAINSGSTFTRAATLVSSYFNEIIGDLKEYLPRNYPFESVFLLVSRLSESSKHNYVRNPEYSFHAYVELHISSMRTFGDSCVPCKLQKEATKYYQCAATKPVSEYWELKAINRRRLPFDIVKNKQISEEGYRRLVCSHRLRDYLECVLGEDKSRYFIAVRYFFTELYSCFTMDSKPLIYANVEKSQEGEWLSSGLKVIARPFFSFDQLTRCVVMDLFLLLAEYFLKYSQLNGSELSKTNYKKKITEDLQEDIEKRYLLENEGANLEWICKFAGEIEGCFTDEKCLLEFIRKNILKGLTDLKSNYIFRRSTLIAVFECLSKVYGNDNTAIQKFCESYMRSILRVTHSSSDETRSVWLEYLLQKGTERGEQGNSVNKLKEEICTIGSLKAPFEVFHDMLLIENNRSLVQCVYDISRSVNEGISQQNQQYDIEKWLDESHMSNVISFLTASQNDDSIDKRTTAVLLHRLWKLYMLLSEGNKNDEDSVAGRYESLGCAIQEIVELTVGQRCAILIFERWNEMAPTVEQPPNFPPYCLVSPETDDENNVLMLTELAQREAEWREALDKYGYYLIEKTADNTQTGYHILLALDNNYEAVKKNCTEKYFLEACNKQKILPVYIYIPYEFTREVAINIIRMILMFRCNMISWTERDFNNDTVVSSLQYALLAKHLSEGKISDHQHTGAVLDQQKILTSIEISDDNFERYNSEIFDFAFEKNMGDYYLYRWNLFCSYINSNIARLYRSLIRSGSFNAENIGEFYSAAEEDVWNEPARNLSQVFFDVMTEGHSRKQYLVILLQLVSFEVTVYHGEGTSYTNTLCDYDGGGNGNTRTHLEKRLEMLKGLLANYDLVSFEENGEVFAYRAEYIVAAILDGCISALKSDEWRWSGDQKSVFNQWAKLNPNKKLKVYIKREHSNQNFDYLVIKNEMTETEYARKTKSGMSQFAIRGYIYELWKYFLKNKADEDYRPVFTTLRDGQRCFYVIKLPILKKMQKEVNT